MKRDKIIVTIVIGIMFLILTAIIFAQFRSIDQTDILALENMRENELRKEISSYKTKVEEVKKGLKETKEKIKEYEAAITSDEEASELLTKELDKQNNLLGKNDVKGNGIIIELKDTRAKRITVEDIRDLINQLKAAGAEAISVNEQRIVYDSYIVDIGGTFISINGKTQVSPYEIKAIGDPTYLESGLSKKQYGYIDTKKEEGKDIDLSRKNGILISKYKGSLNMEYVKEEK